MATQITTTIRFVIRSSLPYPIVVTAYDYTFILPILVTLYYILLVRNRSTIQFVNCCPCAKFEFSGSIRSYKRDWTQIAVMRYVRKMIRSFKLLFVRYTAVLERPQINEYYYYMIIFLRLWGRHTHPPVGFSYYKHGYLRFVKPYLGIL